MKVAVTGATGFIGRALCNDLASRAEVVALTRRPEKARTLLDNAVDVVGWDTNSPAGWEKCLEGTDTIVNLAGANIASGRWTGKFKAKILDSRTEAADALLRAIKNLRDGPKTVISASGVGFYGDRDDEILEEDSAGGTGFLPDVAREIERCAGEFEALGLRSVVARIGIVLGPGGGALPKMTMPFKFYLGGYWGSGKQWISWISLADEVAAIEFLIENPNLSGVFNLTSPRPLRNRQFFKILAGILKKPCWLPLPGAVLKIMFGRMADELFLASQRVYPKRLIEAGFEFKCPELENIRKGRTS